jgi:GT2 family glycosyltransferase
VLLSWQKFDRTTGPCLDTLLAGAWPDGVELILVDNGSTDGAAAACAARAAADPRIRYLPLDSNLGFGGGMNAGAAQARGEWLVLVNSDTLWPPSALSRLAHTARAQLARVAMLGPVTNAAGNGQALHLPGASHAQALQWGERAMAEPTGLTLATYRTDFFCAAVRRSAWQALQGLDPVFGLGYYEDFDFSLRLRAAGHEQVITEDVFIVHAGSVSFGAQPQHQRDLMQRNHAIFKHRHPRALMLHQRAGNAAALAGLVAAADARGWTDALRARAAWRYAMLVHELPRSPLKRWLWLRRQRALCGALDRAGIMPRYPDLAGPA